MPSKRNQLPTAPALVAFRAADAAKFPRGDSGEHIVTRPLVQGASRAHGMENVPQPDQECTSSAVCPIPCFLKLAIEIQEALGHYPDPEFLLGSTQASLHQSFARCLIKNGHLKAIRQGNWISLLDN